MNDSLVKTAKDMLETEIQEVVSAWKLLKEPGINSQKVAFARGCEVITSKDYKIRRILRHIEKYGYKVMLTSDYPDKTAFAFVDMQSKLVWVLTARVDRFNTWARKYHRVRQDYTEILVHELAHVIEDEEVKLTLFCHVPHTLQYLRGRLQSYDLTIELDHDYRFWSIYHNLCKKYRIRNEARYSYIALLEELYNE